MVQGLAPDGGLYMPEELPLLSDEALSDLSGMKFNDLAFQMASPFLKGEIGEDTLHRVISDAFDFPTEISEPEPGRFVLELFHGPTLAFKDYGARFMARLFSELSEKRGEEVTILVATSGDTGSAVANGFYKVPGVNVFVLYPNGKVSPLQEKQFTTLGENITALEVDGVFDDCQKLVKQAFVDAELRQKMQLSSANSINIARLLPQSFYYGYASAALKARGKMPPVFSVPSGNFGNLTGGLFAEKMGIPAAGFLAATNANSVVPEFLNGSEFTPRASVQTISNAMDVGNPSNFDRIRHLCSGDDSLIRKTLRGYSYSDQETRDTIAAVYQKTGYLMCPHTAVGYRAAEEYIQENEGAITVTLATAHPVKFREVVEPVIGQTVSVPERLRPVLRAKSKSTSVSAHYLDFRDLLLSAM
jgi:threonine synthase